MPETRIRYGVRLTSFAVVDASAFHWYATVWRYDEGLAGRSIEAGVAIDERPTNYRLTARQAARLNRNDRTDPKWFQYRPGMNTDRFEAREDAIKRAVEVAQEVWGYSGPLEVGSAVYDDNPLTMQELEAEVGLQ